ncbi:MAG: alpha/beta hydrolase [Paracoccaceae bacterium]|nr:alpha/beta hydrolase [Paracoccaceae bacterium]
MTPTFYTHARTFGHGTREALAIHCTLAHSATWRGVGHALADIATLTAIDLPSHGKSDDWDGQVDLHRLCTDAALAHLPYKRDVIGHSFGATVALRLAVENPDLVRSLTLIEPVFFAAACQDAPDQMRAHDDEAAPYMAALATGDMAHAARLFNRLWGDGTKWDDLSAKTRRSITDRMYVVTGQSPMIFEDNAGIMVPGRLERLSMLVLLLQGSQALDIIDAINSSLARRLPNVRRAVITGAGHMSPLTHPTEVAKEIAALFEMAEE